MPMADPPRKPIEPEGITQDSRWVFATSLTDHCMMHDILWDTLNPECVWKLLFLSYFSGELPG